MADDFDDLDVQLGEAEHKASPSGPIVLVRDGALAQMQAHAREDLDHELGGIMLGSASSSPEGTLVFVEAVIRALHTDASRGSVTFTHETWEEINRIKDREHPDKRIVGWYHTHPGFGLFLSEYDLFIHRNFFNVPWQTAFVIDPRADKAGFFVWNGSEIEGPRGFETVGEGAPGPALIAPSGELSAPLGSPRLRVALLAWQWLVLAGMFAVAALLAFQLLRPPVQPQTDGQVSAQLAAIERKLADLEGKVASPEPTPAPETACTEYVVKPGDSLWRIAKAQYGDGAMWGAIAVFNGIEPDDLEPGMTLRIPTPAAPEDLPS